MLLVILGAVSRIGFLVFVCGGITYFFLKVKGFSKKIIFVLAGLSAVTFLLMMFSVQERWGEPGIQYLRRGQTRQELVTFTGRTLVWKQVLRQVPDSPLTGHGYGVTRFTLKPITWEYRAPHCHNEVMETVFATGIVGLIAMAMMLLYSVRWFTSFSILERIFSSNVALHATSVIIMLLVSMFFEARIAVRVLPYQPIFFFYLLVLDRKQQFAGMKKLAS
jgi:O-antigen ligase